MLMQRFVDIYEEKRKGPPFARPFPLLFNPDCPDYICILSSALVHSMFWKKELM